MSTQRVPHPLELAEVHVFKQYPHYMGKGDKFVARFYPYDKWPIFFHGKTRREVIRSAETFRTTELEKHDNQYQRTVRMRMERLKRKASKKTDGVPVMEDTEV